MLVVPSRGSTPPYKLHLLVLTLRERHRLTFNAHVNLDTTTQALLEYRNSTANVISSSLSMSVLTC